MTPLRRLVAGFPTAAAPVRSQVRPCGMCEKQSVNGAGFLRVLLFPLPIIDTPTAPHSVIVLSGLDTNSVVKTYL
jgi:hypothetical protein